MSRTHDETTQQILAVLAGMAARIDAIGARIEAALSQPAAPAPIEVKWAVELPEGFNAAEMESFLQASASWCPHALSSLAASQPMNFGGYSEQRLAALDATRAELLANNGYTELASAVEGVEYNPVGLGPATERQLDRAAWLTFGIQTRPFDKARQPVERYEETINTLEDAYVSPRKEENPVWFANTGVQPVDDDARVYVRRKNGKVSELSKPASHLDWRLDGENQITHWRCRK